MGMGGEGEGWWKSLVMEGTALFTFPLCQYVCMSIRLCKGVCVLMCVWVYVCVCVYVCVPVCMYVCVSLRTH